MSALRRLQKLAAFKIDGVDLGIMSPQARGILGGAIAGGAAGGYAGGEENRKKGILAGALAGGLGGGAIADVMANRTARGFKVGDKMHARSVKDGVAERKVIGRGHLGDNYKVQPEFEAFFKRQGVERGDIGGSVGKHMDESTFTDPEQVAQDIRDAARLNKTITRSDFTAEDRDVDRMASLGDAYRNRALKRGAGALAAGGAGVLASRRDREKQASFMGGPSILGVNLEKRASVYGGAAAGGLLGAAYGHFGTKKEDRNWKRTLGHAGIGALTGGSMGLARKRGLEVGRLNEETKGLRGNLTDLQGELANTHSTLRNTSDELRNATVSNTNLTNLLDQANSQRQAGQSEIRRLQGELSGAQDALDRERRQVARTNPQPPVTLPTPDQPLTLQQALARNRDTAKFQQGLLGGNRFNREARARGNEQVRAQARKAEEQVRAQAAQAAQLAKEEEQARQASISAVKSMKLRRSQIVDASKVEPDEVFNELTASGNFRANLQKMVDEGRITDEQADSYDALRFVSQDPARLRLRERYMAARARRGAQSKTASLMCAPSILGSAYWY